MLPSKDTCSGRKTHARDEIHMLGGKDTCSGGKTHARGERHMLGGRDTCSGLETHARDTCFDLKTQGAARKTQGGASAGRENRALPFSPSSGPDPRDSRGSRTSTHPTGRRRRSAPSRETGDRPGRIGKPRREHRNRAATTSPTMPAAAYGHLLRVEKHMLPPKDTCQRHMLPPKDTCQRHMLRPEDTGWGAGPDTRTARPGFRCRATPTPRIGGHELLRIRPFSRSTEPGECVKVGVSRLREFGRLVTTGRRRRRPRRWGAARPVEPGRYRSDWRRPDSSRASFWSSGQDSTSAL